MSLNNILSTFSLNVWWENDVGVWKKFAQEVTMVFIKQSEQKFGNSTNLFQQLHRFIDSFADGETVLDDQKGPQKFSSKSSEPFHDMKDNSLTPQAYATNDDAGSNLKAHHALWFIESHSIINYFGKHGPWLCLPSCQMKLAPPTLRTTLRLKTDIKWNSVIQ